MILVALSFSAPVWTPQDDVVDDVFEETEQIVGWVRTIVVRREIRTSRLSVIAPRHDRWIGSAGKRNMQP